MDLDKSMNEFFDQLKKAAVVASTYSFSPATRSIFAPENLDAVVKVLVPTTTPLRNVLNRVPGKGQAASWKKLTSQLSNRLPNQGGANGTGVSGFFADGGQPNQTTQTYSVVSASYKNIGRDVEVGRQFLASSQGYMDARDIQVKIKTVEVMLAEEDANINGDSAFDTLAYDGLIKQITTNSGTLSLLTASGVGSQLQTTWWSYGGDPDQLFTNPRQLRALADELQATGAIQRIMMTDQGAAVGGQALAAIINPTSGHTIKATPHRLIGSWALLLDYAGDDGTSYIEMEDLEGMSVYEPPTANHSVISRVYESTVEKLIGEPQQVKIGGLAVS